ncbi:hypothetical protein V1279_006510 [Bradyrhizobium sp. AZCC 1610]
MLEGFSGTLVVVDELASGFSWMREARPKIAAPLLEDPSRSLA